MQRRLERVDWVTFLTRDVVLIVTAHLQTLRQTDALADFPSHPALVSEEAEVSGLNRATMPSCQSCQSSL